VDEQRARQLLSEERRRLLDLLEEVDHHRVRDREAGDEHGDLNDGAEPLTAEGTDDAVAAGLRARLDAIARAEARLEAGTYGRSVRSGAPIPDERLEADPAAELTVEEAVAPR
jgi:DnaK suppressor protein